MWSTFSDPLSVAMETYGQGKMVYNAVHNMLKAHACIFNAFHKTPGTKGLVYFHT